MTSSVRVGLLAVCLTFVQSGVPAASQQSPDADRPLPNFDTRDGRPRSASPVRQDARRFGADPQTGALREADVNGLRVAGQGSAAIARTLRGAAGRLGLDAADLNDLRLERDYVSSSNGVRHVIFRQTLDGIDVMDAVVAVHIAPTGEVLRLFSTAARGEGRRQARAVDAGSAAVAAAANIRPNAPFVARASNRPSRGNAVSFARGPFKRDVEAEQIWIPAAGTLRLAWRVTIEPDGEPQVYDVVVDADTADVLLRRNRVLYDSGQGRVLQSSSAMLADPRRPDPRPSGVAECPPVLNHELRDLTSPFRDGATVLGSNGTLAGNNTHVYRRNAGAEAEPGTPTPAGWVFDFPVDSAGAAETSLFFALNFAHDFFYDLGFDEAAGNFQANNFGRGGVGGDPVIGLARATGRNNATFQPAAEGLSPTISMFLWDGVGCWGRDLDGDGTLDLDGDMDLDVVLHEFHHGVSHRLNTSFYGNEADAIGEGGGDFFSYSVNGDTLLAEYARPGGLRSVNSKTYGDWSCLLGFFCEPHDNGEIWANVLWDLRERFRADAVNGSPGAGIREVHQLYVDALALSPPQPTMLDMRDAILDADAMRHPSGGNSVNFCRIWETFAARGMGTDATDTSTNPLNQVQAGSATPAGCIAPPPPPTVSITATIASIPETGGRSAFRIARSVVGDAALTVGFLIGGTAANGVDYVALQTSATIPAGASYVEVAVTPIDDTLVESAESVTLTLRAGTAYTIGAPAAASVSIVSDDVAPDLVIATLTAPQSAGPGEQISIADTTKNQGSGSAPSSTTSYYLSRDFLLDASDTLLGSRTVPALATNASSSGSLGVTLPADLTAGTYAIFAKADAAAELSEVQETNNTRVFSLKVGPDLVVSTLTVPATAGAGGMLTVTETTMNQGGGSAGASVTRFYLSTNFSLDASDVPLQGRGVPGLTTGASSTATTTVIIPAGTATGQYYVIANADDGAAVLEPSETNNSRSAQVRIGPDLAVSSITAPARAAVGGTITVTDTTVNQGSGAASASSTAFYLSDDYTLDAGDARLTSVRSVPALAAGASSTGSTTLAVPNVEPGLWYLMARADDTAQVDETLETNNVKYVTILVGPDLVVSSVVAVATAAPGATISVTDTVKNNGAGTAAASVTKFYLSTNVSFDAGDVLLSGERAVPSLAAGATNTGATNVTLPSGITGLYYIIAVADGTNVVAEANDANNAAAKGVTIR